MHKNSYNPKTLNGNWFENRFTEDFDKKNDESSNTYLANPSYNKYIATSRAIGNAEPYEKVNPLLFSYQLCLVTFRLSHPKCDQLPALI